MFSKLSTLPYRRIRRCTSSQFLDIRRRADLYLPPQCASAVKLAPNNSVSQLNFGTETPVMIRDILFEGSPYSEFDANLYPDDIQGWGSDDPILMKATQLGALHVFGRGDPGREDLQSIWHER